MAVFTFCLTMEFTSFVLSAGRPEMRRLVKTSAPKVTATASSANTTATRKDHFGRRRRRGGGAGAEAGVGSVGFGSVGGGCVGGGSFVDSRPAGPRPSIIVPTVPPSLSWYGCGPRRDWASPAKRPGGRIATQPPGVLIARPRRQG